MGPSKQRVAIKVVALVVGLRAVYFDCRTIPVLIGIIFGEIRVPIEGFYSAVTLAFFLVGTLLDIALPFYAWGLFRGQAASRIGAIWILCIQVILTVVGYAWSGGKANIVLPVNLIVSLISISLVLIRSARRGLEAPTQKDFDAYEKRMERYAKIRSSWRNFGHYERFVLINIALFNFILAPFTYIAAWTYYLLAVLPNKPLRKMKR